MKHLLTVNGLAVHTGLPCDWLRAETTAGRIPCIRISRKLVFSLEAVEKGPAERAATRQEDNDHVG
ncbi:MAG TPA: hypothetical protein VKE94_04070 [Gemmataceae bacterium]|nr:hypothetical protein [Gemmataceae bacterium]